MKIKFLTMGLAAGLMAGTAFAAINPSAPGLPGQLNGTTWAVTSGRGYDNAATSLAGNPASAMCVECHYTNPSARVMGPTGNGTPFRGGSYAVTRAMTGSHTVMASAGFTNSGGGFLGSANPDPGTRNTREYMKVDTWASGAYSKYGSGAGYVSVTAPSGTTDPDMICESCHNVLINSGDQLLVGTYANATDDTMCVNCHTHGDGTPTADYTGFHKNGNLPAFSSTASHASNGNFPGRKRHHVLNKIGTPAGWRDTVASGPYNPDGSAATNDSVMWAPSYTRELGNGSGTGKYKDWVWTTTVADGAQYQFRDRWNVTGVGTLAQAAAAGDIPTAGSASSTNDTLLCTSCHRPHNAETSAGAFIFRNGTGAAGTPYSANAAVTGLTRQIDLANYTTEKVYGEYKNLCNGCHVGYGN